MNLRKSKAIFIFLQMLGLAKYLERETRPLAVGGHQLLECGVLLDLELHNVPVLAHHLQARHKTDQLSDILYLQLQCC